MNDHAMLEEKSLQCDEPLAFSRPGRPKRLPHRSVEQPIDMPHNANTHV
jgi:hypothetical protein